MNYTSKALYLIMIMHTTICHSPLHGTESSSSPATAQNVAAKKNQWITIWVHGTRLTPKAILPHFFHVEQGLNKAETLDTSYHHRTIGETLADLDPEQFTIEHFYLFGWSGQLSFKKRREAAQDLYNALTKLISEYKTIYNAQPNVRIITHSHGGNVALNLAHFITDKDTIVIDELVLLACPVQEKTKKLLEHSCFGNIYSFYSTRDVLQVIDPQGIYGEDFSDLQWNSDVFSHRQFPEHAKLKQVEVSYNGRGLLHVEFLLINKLAGFVRHLPSLLKTIRECPNQLQKITLPK